MEQLIYDRMWAESQPKISAGEAEPDPHLLDRASDRRRGITLIVRPDADVTERLGGVIGRMAELEPEQYYYRPGELHITVLSLVMAAEDFVLDDVPVEDYDRVLAGVCSSFPPFRIRFHGVTASASAVLAQGLAGDDALNRLRDNLREALGAAGYGHLLDRRYRSTTAHVTLARFQRPLRDSQRFSRLLSDLRDQDLGETTFGSAQFVFNDWYMAEDVVRTLHTYKLSGS